MTTAPHRRENPQAAAQVAYGGQGHGTVYLSALCSYTVASAAAPARTTSSAPAPAASAVRRVSARRPCSSQPADAEFSFAEQTASFTERVM